MFQRFPEFKIMYYFSRSLIFLFVWVAVESSPMLINQEIYLGASSGNKEAVNKEGAGGAEVATTTTTTTTTAAPTCEDLSSKGYNNINSLRWMRFDGTPMSAKDCKALCKADDTRQAVIKSEDDVTLLLALFSSGRANEAWIGLEQKSLTDYEWADGTAMTVNPADGSTDLPDNYENWVGTEDYDKNGGLDADTCFFLQYGAEVGWDEANCETLMKPCACECNY